MSLWVARTPIMLVRLQSPKVASVTSDWMALLAEDSDINSGDSEEYYNQLVADYLTGRKGRNKEILTDGEFNNGTPFDGHDAEVRFQLTFSQNDGNIFVVKKHKAVKKRGVTVEGALLVHEQLHQDIFVYTAIMLNRMLVKLERNLVNEDLAATEPGQNQALKFEKHYDGDPFNIDFPHGTGHDPEHAHQMDYWNPGKWAKDFHKEWMKDIEPEFLDRRKGDDV